jgi:hypothetical protein
MRRLALLTLVVAFSFGLAGCGREKEPKLKGSGDAGLRLARPVTGMGDKGKAKTAKPR